MGMHWPAAIVRGCLGLPAVAEEFADRILVGGRILTVDAEDRVAEALAVKDASCLVTIFDGNVVHRSESFR
jgi:hypothetical protein